MTQKKAYNIQTLQDVIDGMSGKNNLAHIKNKKNTYKQQQSNPQEAKQQEAKQQEAKQQKQPKKQTPKCNKKRPSINKYKQPHKSDTKSEYEEPQAFHMDALHENDKANKHITAEKQTPKPAFMSQKKLRSTAFALLTRREHSKKEMYEKLTSYGAKPEDVESLLTEFAQKTYQSDSRTGQMLVRQAIHKGQGVKRLQNTLKKYAVDDADDAIQNLIEETNWLVQAVAQRKKRFGEALPTAAKDKAKQLRFLQYRGYTSDICYQAIKSNDVS